MVASLESITHKSTGGLIHRERVIWGERRTGCFLTCKVLFCPMGLVYTATGSIAKGTFAIFSNVADWKFITHALTSERHWSKKSNKIFSLCSHEADFCLKIFFSKWWWKFVQFIMNCLYWAVMYCLMRNLIVSFWKNVCTKWLNEWRKLFTSGDWYFLYFLWVCYSSE